MKKLYIPILLLVALTTKIKAQDLTSKENADVSAGPNKSKMVYSPVSNGEPIKVDTSETLKSKKEIKGDRLYFIFSYDKANEAYKSDENLSVDGQRHLARGYYKMKNDTLCEKAYVKLLNTPGGNYPEDYYNYSMALKSVGKYEESAKMMDLFALLKSEDLRVKDYQANKAQIKMLLKDNGKFKIKHLNLNTNAEDFGPAFYKNKIVFASSRTTKMYPKNSYRNGKPYLNIYMAEIAKDQLQTPENFDKSLNGNMNEGPSSFSKDGLFMAYTKNDYSLTKKQLIVNVAIYFRTFSEGAWSKPESFVVNNKAYSVGHPALSQDGKTMYFTSDMPGGCGGADIYRVSKNGLGVWSQPENLGNTINTEGNEVFPFYEENKRILYFASNGHFGLGGLDIFSSENKGSSFGKVENLGSPLNTSADDFSLIVDSTDTKGYFASNRQGGAGDDDIYTVEFLKVKRINGTAKDKEDNQLANTFISLFDNNNVLLDTFSTANNGVFTFTVETNKNYKLTGEKATYNNGSNEANTYGSDLIVVADVILLMPDKIEKNVLQNEPKPILKEEKDLAKIHALKPIYFDYHEFSIREDAKIELDKIVKIMNEKPLMAVELKGNTDCRSSRRYNQILSDKRARATANYIKDRITNPSRISGKGYGETQLVNNCSCEGVVISTCSEELHQANRRTEFVVVKKPVLVKP